MHSEISSYKFIKLFKADALAEVIQHDGLWTDDADHFKQLVADVVTTDTVQHFEMPQLFDMYIFSEEVLDRVVGTFLLYLVEFMFKVEMKRQNSEAIVVE